MKTLKIYLIGLLMAGFAVATGCSEDSTVIPGSTDPQDSDSDTGNNGTESPIKVDLTNCGAAGTFTCENMIAAETPENCIADFSYGTNQVGKTVDGAFTDKVVNINNTESTTIGFYGYNDKTPGGTMDPKPNNDGAEPAADIQSCGSAPAKAMRIMVEGWTVWGAGVGMDWGGEKNPNCDEATYPGVLACMQYGVDDNKFNLATTLAKTECVRTDPVQQAAFEDCLKYGKRYKEMRDLTAYKGIGFWMLTGEGNQAANVKVTFPIPESARFLWERPETAGSEGCIEEVDGKACFNDFATTVPVDMETNKWFYHEVLFENLSYSDWGYEPTQYPSFPKNRSIGIKFQIDKAGGPASSNIYIDDIVLLPMAK